MYLNNWCSASAKHNLRHKYSKEHELYKFNPERFVFVEIESKIPAAEECILLNLERETSSRSSYFQQNLRLACKIFTLWMRFSTIYYLETPDLFDDNEKNEKSMIF